MPNFETSRIVKHTARQMYDLVADVEHYPDFLPYCEKLVVRSRRPMDETRELVIADMTVGYKFVRETFTSRISLDPGQCRIDVSALEGPFRTLGNCWRFMDQATVNTSEVRFEISWEFKNRILGNLVGSLFDRAFRKYAEAFEARADVIYGRA